MNEYQVVLEKLVNGLVEFGECLGMACHTIDKATEAVMFFVAALKELERNLARRRVLEWEGVWLWD